MTITRIALLAKLGYEVEQERFGALDKAEKRNEKRNKKPNKKPNKYGAKPTGTHASKKEHRRALELKAMQHAGLISGLREQVPYELIPTQYEEQTGDGGKPRRVCIERSCRYIADFVYTDNATGRQIVEDTKGFRTPEYKIKRKLMLHVHGIRIKEV